MLPRVEEEPLSKAAKRLNVDTRTLKGWLEGDMGIEFPRLKRGCSPLVRKDYVEIVARARRGLLSWEPKHWAQTQITAWGERNQSTAKEPAKPGPKAQQERSRIRQAEK